MSWFRRYRQLLSTFSPSTGKYLSTVSGCHTLAEAVLVPSLSLRRLKRSFHGVSSLLTFKYIIKSIAGQDPKTGRKYTKSFLLNKPYY